MIKEKGTGNEADEGASVQSSVVKRKKNPIKTTLVGEIKRRPGFENKLTS